MAIRTRVYVQDAAEQGAIQTLTERFLPVICTNPLVLILKNARRT